MKFLSRCPGTRGKKGFTPIEDRGFTPIEDRGFTLLEVLIAIFILAIIMTIVFGSFTGIVVSSSEAERKIDLYQTARSLMDIFSADIRGIFPQPAEDEGYFFKASLDETVGMDTVPRLDFITTHSLLIGLEKNPFLSEVTYTLRKDPRSELYTLIRRSESPPSYPFEEGGKEIPLCRTIESFNIQLITDEEPSKEMTGQIPRAMIIEFTLNLNGEKENFVTMVRPMITLGAPGAGVPGSAKSRQESQSAKPESKIGR
jgi:general secretion pathway protein J